jgi:xylose isomerase
LYAELPDPADKVQAFRADPEVAEALAAARVAELSEPTLAEGESLADLRAEKYDREALADRGLGFEKLDQLAMEHLLGVR